MNTLLKIFKLYLHMITCDHSVSRVQPNNNVYFWMEELQWSLFILNIFLYYRKLTALIHEIVQSHW